MLGGEALSSKEDVGMVEVAVEEVEIHGMRKRERKKRG